MKEYLLRSFGYRRRYVDAVVELAPRRGTLAVAAEAARLAFAAAGSLLVALVFWLLVAGALRGSGAWLVASLLCAVVATLCGLAAIAGVFAAARDLRRVRSLVRTRAIP